MSWSGRIQGRMAKNLGQPIVSENFGGAGGMIAAARGARALSSGQVDLASQSAVVSGLLVKPGKLKPLAVIGRKRFCGPARPAHHG